MRIPLMPLHPAVFTVALKQLQSGVHLDAKSPAYNKVFAVTVFHYSARATKDEHFKVCIVTGEMRDAVWRYSHQSQIILDSTFGLCDSKMLLFIVMGIDKKGRGVPLVFMMFSAPSGNQKTLFGYDTKILEKLIRH